MFGILLFIDISASPVVISQVCIACGSCFISHDLFSIITVSSGL
ncbi:MAG: hypothetical protein WCG25_00610 [bacterium]